MSAPRPRHIPILAHFPGINSQTLWMDPDSGSHIEFDSFLHMANTAERGRFAALFLAEGLRLRERRRQIYERDIAGRPDAMPMLSGLAARTRHLGLVGTISSTFNEPYEIARQVMTLHALSGGRVGWNVVTSWDSFVGANFRRGQYLTDDEPYERAASFLRLSRQLWRSWRRDEERDTEPGAEPAWTVSPVEYRDRYFDFSNWFNMPLPDEGEPVILAAGQSERGREFASRDCDVLLCLDGAHDERRKYYADVKRRVVAHGRPPEALAMMRTITFVIGDTAAEANERSRYVQRLWCDDATTRRFVEQLWNIDLSDRDPDGPVPREDPSAEAAVARGLSSVRRYPDPVATANEWRAEADARGWSMRELVMEKFGRPTTVGTPETIAASCIEMVDSGTCDGLILMPYTSPRGLDGFADRVSPILQERGRLFADYPPGGIRAALGLPPVRVASTVGGRA